MLYIVLGKAAFGGMAVMASSLLLGLGVSKVVEIFQERLLKTKDARMEIINEVLGSIRVIKYYAWELKFTAKITEARRAELRNLRKYAVTDAVLFVIWEVVPALVGAAAFVIHTQYLGRPMTPATGFTALTLFNLLRFPLNVFPDMINYFVRTKVSLRRIEEFLRTPDVGGMTDVCEEGGSFEEVLERSDFQGNAQPRATVIFHQAHLHIPAGALAVVVGVTGVGKSSLLQGALCGEALRPSGVAALGGRVSFVTQSPWIQNATLRENVLFGAPYVESRYEQVIHCCALTSDLKLLPKGDSTEIGEKGVNLSGGQQQRVSLARAAYAYTDIILLDDPLSAVDALVGEHIFSHLIMGFLKDRTRVLVTHNITLAVASADLIVCIDAVPAGVGAGWAAGGAGGA
ncbi:P-loop containing nucleoside triphosphate hydrolase protein, partial [Ochromonadaceae sp. CCMP2298]